MILSNSNSKRRTCSPPKARAARSRPRHSLAALYAGGIDLGTTKTWGIARLPGFGRLCYNGAAVKQGVKPISAAPDVEERDVEESRSIPSHPGLVPAGKTTHDDASRFCPVCSQRLESRHCKLICDVCGYYMSCADFY